MFWRVFYQVLVGPLDSEENHNQARWEQLPEEENDPKDDVGLTADLLHVGLMDREPVDASVLPHLLLLLMSVSRAVPDRKHCTSCS